MAYFDDALIPWNRVFHIGKPDHAKLYPQRLFDWIHAETQIRHVVNAEMIAGLGILITEALGTAQAPIVASEVADLVRFREACRAFTIAAEETGFMSPGGRDESRLRCAVGHRAAGGRSLHRLGRRRTARPAPAESRARALGRDHAEVELLGRRIVLGRRHSELVVLLALQRRGMSGEELARALYGATGSDSPCAPRSCGCGGGSGRWSPHSPTRGTSGCNAAACTA